MKGIPFILAMTMATVQCSAAVVSTLSAATDRDILGSSERIAQPFRTLDDAFIVTETSVMGYYSQTSQQVAVKIYSDSSNLPGSSLATIFSGTAGSAGFQGNLGSSTPAVFNGLSLVLEPNTKYWLVVENRSLGDLSMGVTLGTVNSSNPMYSSGGAKGSFGLTGNSWLTNTFDLGFRVTAVPEPACVTLGLLGAACLIRRKRRS